MNVLYDHQAFMQKYGGVSRYYTSIIKEFNNEDNIKPILPYFYTDNAYYPNKKILLKFNIKGKYILYNEINKIISKKYLTNKSFDLLHATYFDTYFLKYYNGPFVITIHDMIHDIFPNMLSDKQTSDKRKYLAQKATKIIAVSQNTKNDILKYIKNIPEDKIEVIYHATNLTYINNERPFFTDPYLLYVGERHSYKNFIFFLKSIKDILRRYNINLICAGGPPFTKIEKKLFAEENIVSKVIYVPIFTDKQLSNLYNNAIAFCYPSLYEGFGIPILEAFACKCPVIISNTSCFPEIAQDNVIYFNPLNKNDIQESIRYILNNPSIREKLIIKGYNRAKDFSWKYSAEKTKHTYLNSI